MNVHFLYVPRAGWFPANFKGGFDDSAFIWDFLFRWVARVEKRAWDIACDDQDPCALFHAIRSNDWSISAFFCAFLRYMVLSVV